ncbi:hypothetical protein V8D89_008872 [Ganoderma adspersum]
MQSPVLPSVLPLPPIARPALATPTFIQGSSIRPTPLLSTLVARAKEYALINKDIHEAIDRAASDPMDTDPLKYTATGVSLEDLASTEDKWNQFIHDQAAVAQGQPLDSPQVQSKNPAEDHSIAEEATTTIDPIANPFLVIPSQVFTIPKEDEPMYDPFANFPVAQPQPTPGTSQGPESESGLLCACYYKGWVVICSLDNHYYHLLTDRPDYLALTQSMNSTPIDRDEVLQWFYKVYMGDWQYTDDHGITNFRNHADHFFKDLDDMNGRDDLGGGEGANVTIPGLVI